MTQPCYFYLKSVLEHWVSKHKGSGMIPHKIHGWFEEGYSVIFISYHNREETVVHWTHLYYLALSQK